jgi:hypothetical protein
MDVMIVIKSNADSPPVNNIWARVLIEITHRPQHITWCTMSEFPFNSTDY